MHRLIWVQVSLLAICAICFSLLWELQAGIAAAWGGLIALANSLLLARSVFKAGRAALRNGKAGMAHLYYGFIGRFAIVLIGMAVSVLHWGLPIIPTIVGITVVSMGAALTERLT